MRHVLLALLLCAVAAAGETVDPGLIVTPPAVRVFPKFELSAIHIGGDASKGARTMVVIVPLFEVETGKQHGVWSYTFAKEEYNMAQAAYTSDSALFAVLCQKLGNGKIDFSKVPLNQTNVLSKAIVRPPLSAPAPK